MKHPSAPFQVKGKKSSSTKPPSAIFPYPTVDFNEFDVNVPGHLSPPATDAAAALLPTPASSGVTPSYPPSVPPAIRAKQRRREEEAKREQSSITIKKQDSGATEDWWKGLVSTSATALRPAATFRNDQTMAEEAVERVERIPDGVVSTRKSSLVEPPPLPPLSVDSNSDSDIPLSPESDDDDDLAYTQLPTKVTVQGV
eukprot:TRINITY_DN10430_c0_g1_i2.p1 TRINITY_DN10430_c0_g1~~TRINITY_DN10430_c0_g1_i2.p1  ORF type:complete len:232 (+),score=48.25 TRINITY_DN10430_c0_g1_i2:100-696(+)